MEINFTHIRDELVDSLHSLIAGSEEIYLSLAEVYPLLLKEMETSISASDNAVSTLEGMLSGNTRGGSLNIGSLLHSSRELVQNAGREFSALHSRDDELLSVLTQNIERISSLKSIIQNIRQDSEDMELISLNAMTVAIKAGKDGGAFSYITEELKRVSERTITYTDELIKNGNELQQMFETFKTSVTHIEEVEGQFADRFKNILDQGFENFTRGIQDSIRNARSLTEESRGVSGPLFTIMQEIQNQDIIKQSIEHAILSMEQFTPISEESPEEEILDEISFLADVSSLCSVILTDVRSKLSKSAEVFREHGGAVEGLLGRIEQKRQGFLQESFSGREETGRNLAVLFKSSEEIFTKLSRNIHEELQIGRAHV